MPRRGVAAIECPKIRAYPKIEYAEDVLREMGIPAMSEWQPIETYEDGEHVLFWLPHGERGVGGMETGMLFRGDGDWHFWTHGGPNSGSDFEMFEKPTHWMRLPQPPTRGGCNDISD